MDVFIKTSILHFIYSVYPTTFGLNKKTGKPKTAYRVGKKINQF
jgi:hypothetical protein